MSALDKISKLLDMFGGNQNTNGVPFANRNLIVDGNKEVWSGTTAALTTTEAYTVNVLQGASAGTGGAGTYSQETFAAGVATTYGLAHPAVYYGQFAQTTASTGTLAANTGPLLYRRIENVATTDSAPLTLSVWLWSSAPMTVTQVYSTQNFGAGGTPSASMTTLVPVNWAITTIPQRFSVLVTPPSIIGKAIGTTPGYTEFGLSLPIGSTFTLNDAQWQLEYSSAQSPAAGLPTVFEYRGQQAESARVTRYYQQVSVSIAGFSSSPTYIETTVTWSPMRVPPTVYEVYGGTYSGISANALYTMSSNSGRFEVLTTGTGGCYAEGYGYALSATL